MQADYVGPQELILERHIPGQNPFRRMNQFHPRYDPAAYTLMFPYGTAGYTTDIFIDNDKVTQMGYYSHYLSVRPNSLHYFRYGRLLHQYAVDMYSKIEQERLGWIELNQNILLADQYPNNEHEDHMVLPSSFTGGPRYMAEAYHDAMTLVREFGKADLLSQCQQIPHGKR